MFRVGRFLLLLIVAFFRCSAHADAQPQSRSYETSDTSLANIDLKSLGGAILPLNLRAHSELQRKLATSIQLSLQGAGVPVPGSNKPYGDARDLCNPNLRQFDWRQHNIITPVRNQLPCSSCFSFAATAVFEASWKLINKQDIHVSEQQILDCAKAGSCTGGWHAAVFNFIRDKGVTTADEIPYVGQQSPICQTSHQANFRLINWDYVDSLLGLPSNANVKKALCSYGPVSAGVFITDEFKKYKNGIFDEFAHVNGPTQINHDISIVGWDDDQQIWIVKNSWDTGWGEQGFMRIKYGANNIGYGATWVHGFPVSLLRSNQLQSMISKGLRLLSPQERRTLFEFRLPQ